MHLSVVNDPLTEALAILVLNFETAVGTSPLLNRGIGHSGEISSIGLSEHLPIYHLAGKCCIFPRPLCVQVDVTILAS